MKAFTFVKGSPPIYCRISSRIRRSKLSLLSNFLYWFRYEDAYGEQCSMLPRASRTGKTLMHEHYWGKSQANMKLMIGSSTSYQPAKHRDYLSPSPQSPPPSSTSPGRGSPPCPTYPQLWSWRPQMQPAVAYQFPLPWKTPTACHWNCLIYQSHHTGAAHDALLQFGCRRRMSRTLLTLHT